MLQGEQLIGKLALPSSGSDWHTLHVCQRPRGVRSGVCWRPDPPGYDSRHCTADAERGSSASGPRPAEEQAR